MNEPAQESQNRVTPLELFFDLVVVFAITQVTTFLSRHSDGIGLVRGLLLLGVLWWAWAGYAWLTNSIDPEEGGFRVAMFGATAATLVVAMATPEAFGDRAVVFAAFYFIARIILLGLLIKVGSETSHRPMQRIGGIVVSGLVGPGMLVAASFLTGPGQLTLWCCALAIDYLGVLASDLSVWQVSPDHFSERNGLIIIIALGESIFAIGIGANGTTLGPGVVTAALLGVVVVGALWWSYFDWVTYAIQSRLGEIAGRARAALARDAYSYLHLPMVAGIVLFAFGLKVTLHDVSARLPTIPVIGLCGGIALYLIAHVALRLRLGGGFGRGRPVAAVLMLAVIPAVRLIPALAALGVVGGVSVGLIAYEVLRHREVRALIRSKRGAFTMDEAIQVEAGRTNRV